MSDNFRGPRKSGGQQGYGNQRNRSTVPQGSGNQYSGPQGSGNRYSGQQGSSNRYSGQQGSGNQYTGPQGSGNRYSGPQGSGNRYSGQQGSGNRYSGQQGSGNRYSGPQGSGNRYSGPQVSSKPLPESKCYPPEYPLRLEPGKLGRKIDLIGNFYKLYFGSVITVYHYRLNIGGIDGDGKGDEKTNELRKQSMEKFFNKHSLKIVDEFVRKNPQVFPEDVRYIVSGLANFYTNQELELETGTLERDLVVSIEGCEKSLRIDPELVDRFELDPNLVYEHAKLGSKVSRNIVGDSSSSEKILAVYDILFGFLIGHQYQSFRRKYFDLETAQPLQSQPFLDSVVGFFNSVRRTEFGLALNVHLKMATKISNQFRTLKQLIEAIVGGGNISSGANLNKVNQIIRGLRVFTKHSGKQISYQIERVSMKHPQEQTFRDTKSGKTISIATYFRQQYQLELERLPLIQTIGGRYQLPMELCHLYGNQFLANSKLQQKIQDEILKRSTLKPGEYFDRLQKIVGKICEMDSGVYEKFALKLESKPVQFGGRVLPAPDLRQLKPLMFWPKNGQFIMMVYALLDNSRQSWGKITDEQLRFFIDSLVNKLRTCGLQKIQVFVKILQIDNFSSIEQIFADIDRNRISKPNLLMLGIQQNHYHLESNKQYNLIKHLSNQKYRLVTQCFNIGKINIKIPPGYIDNLISKINGKLGGSNTEIEQRSIGKLPFDLSRTMVVGVDVNHPGATEKIESSIACAVGSYDPKLSQYAASIRVQKRERTELVTQLESMIDELLDEYRKKNSGKYPQNIVLFRDGVSEGQFKTINDVEISLVQKSIDKIRTKLDRSGSIKLTVLVVQKRHHDRFVPLPGQGPEKQQNVPGGTVVDTAIVDPNYRMFYLNSHYSPLGTSKSTKYVLLRDDLHLSTDHLQLLCYYSCFNCVRTPKAISIPTAIRYADLCAYRSKAHILAQIELGSKQMVAKSGSDSSLGIEQLELDIVRRLNQMVKIDDLVKTQLYYS